MELKQTLVFLKEQQTMGLLGGIDFLKQEVSVQDEEEKVTVHSLDNVVILHHIGEDKDATPILNHDIFTHAKEDFVFEVEFISNGHVRLSSVNEKTNSLDTITVTVNELIEKINNDEFKFTSNRYELLAEQAEAEREKKAKETALELRAFNVKICKKKEDNVTHFYYACYDKFHKTVDLMNVVFIGAGLLEKNYKRVTMLLPTFLELLDSGELAEAKPYELEEYARAVHFGTAVQAEDTPMPVFFESELEDRDREEDATDEPAEPTEPPVDYDAEGPDESEDEDSELDDLCDRCGEHDDDCECELY